MEGCMINSSNKEKQNHEANYEESDDEILIKRRISSHPLYGLLLQTHLECLKVGGSGDLEENENRDMKQMLDSKPGLGVLGQSDLDRFMEAYCLALGKLKEAMEEPQQKSMGFINNMHLQLQELTRSRSHLPDQPPPARDGANVTEGPRD